MPTSSSGDSPRKMMAMEDALDRIMKAERRAWIDALEWALSVPHLSCIGQREAIEARLFRLKEESKR